MLNLPTHILEEICADTLSNRITGSTASFNEREYSLFTNLDLMSQLTPTMLVWLYSAQDNK